MTFLPALWDGKLAYPAIHCRLELTALFGSGVIGAGDCLVTAGSGMASSIAAGQCAIPNTFRSPWGGTYLVTNDGPVTVTHAPGKTNPRIDQVCVKVYDSEDGGDASDTVQPIIVEGSPVAGNTLAKSEGLGAIPHNAIVLARVLVPATATKTSECTYEDRREKAIPGQALVNSQAAILGATISAKSIIAAEQERTNAAYGMLATPDEVTVTVPENGLIAVTFQAVWQNSESNKGRAALFVGGNQVKIASMLEAEHAPAIQEAPGGPAATWQALATSGYGLVSADTGKGYSADAITGQIVGIAGGGGTGLLVRSDPGGGPWGQEASALTFVAAGGPLYIDNLPAGTYKIGVQFKSASGAVKVKNRRLKAWVIG